MATRAEVQFNYPELFDKHPRMPRPVASTVEEYVGCGGAIVLFLTCCRMASGRDRNFLLVLSIMLLCLSAANGAESFLGGGDEIEIICRVSLRSLVSVIRSSLEVSSLLFILYGGAIVIAQSPWERLRVHWFIHALLAFVLCALIGQSLISGALIGTSPRIPPFLALDVAALIVNIGFCVVPIAIFAAFLGCCKGVYRLERVAHTVYLYPLTIICAMSIGGGLRVYNGRRGMHFLNKANENQSWAALDYFVEMIRPDFPSHFLPLVIFCTAFIFKCDFRAVLPFCGKKNEDGDPVSDHGLDERTLPLIATEAKETEDKFRSTC